METSELYLKLGEVFVRLGEEELKDKKTLTDLQDIGVEVLELEKSNKELIQENQMLRTKVNGVSNGDITKLLREDNDKWHRIFGVPVFPKLSKGK